MSEWYDNAKVRLGSRRPVENSDSFVQNVLGESRAQRISGLAWAKVQRLPSGSAAS